MLKTYYISTNKQVSTPQKKTPIRPQYTIKYIDLTANLGTFWSGKLVKVDVKETRLKKTRLKKKGGEKELAYLQIHAVFVP